MQAQDVAAQGWLHYILPIGIFIVIMSLRVRRMSQLRPLNPQRLWIVPALYLVITILAFVTTPPDAAGWVLCAVAFVAGGALGWQRGRLMRIDVDPHSHEVTTVQSPAAFLFIVVLIAVRTGIRSMASSGAIGWLPISPNSLTDILVALALGLLSIQRLEMFLRARRLLEEAGRHRPA